MSNFCFNPPWNILLFTLTGAQAPLPSLEGRGSRARPPRRSESAAAAARMRTRSLERSLGLFPRNIHKQAVEKRTILAIFCCCWFTDWRRRTSGVQQQLACSFFRCFSIKGVKLKQENLETLRKLLEFRKKLSVESLRQSYAESWWSPAQPCNRPIK